jgi:hypothetical protein
MKKTATIFLVIGLIILIGVLIYVSIPENDETVLKDNQLMVNEFEYTYDSRVSNICPGGSELFNFSYGDKLIVIFAQKKTFREGFGMDIEDYPDCVDKGIMMKYYDSSIGLPGGLPGECEITEQIPSSFDKPEFLIAKCDIQVTFNILNSDKVNSCISKDSCELINGVDVQLLV